MLALDFARSLAREAVARLRYRWVLHKTAHRYGCTFESGVEIRRVERFRAAPGVIVGSRALVHCGGFDWSGGEGGVTVGERSYIGPHSVLFGAGNIQIGRRVAIAPGVIIASHAHRFGDLSSPIVDQPARFAAVILEDDAYIGAGAIILPGVRVGERAVVAAGAVVTRDVPAGALVAGIPARVSERTERPPDNRVDA